MCFHCFVPLHILPQHFMYNPKPIKLRVVKNYEASTTQDQWFHSQYWKKITNPPHYFVCMAGPHSPPQLIVACWLRVRPWMNAGMITLWYTVIMKHPHQPVEKIFHWREVFIVLTFRKKETKQFDNYVYQFIMVLQMSSFFCFFFCSGLVESTVFSCSSGIR